MYLNLQFLDCKLQSHMSSTFFFFVTELKKNMLESLEFMKNQFLWGPSHPQIFLHDEL